MGKAQVGDTVKVVRTHDVYEAGYVGDVGEVTIVHGFADGDVYEVRMDSGGTVEFYEDEVELAVPPKDYDEDAEYAAKDADVSTWVKAEEIDEYNEIVISLSQAIADKAKEMAERPLLLGEHVGFGCETPAVDMPEDEDDSDAAIYKELRGHGSSEARGILQEGITTEQALAARARALANKRKEDVTKAEKALEEARRKYDEVTADGDIPKASMSIQLDGKAIAQSTILYGGTSGHPHAIRRIEPGPERPSDYPELTEEDEAWINAEPVGAEIIYDEYNPDSVEHPSHYTQGKMEVIEIIAQTVSGYDDGFTAHCVGTATKYLNRAPYKHETPLEDLKKAAKYLEFAIEHEEKKQNG